MDPYPLPYYDQTYFASASAYQPGPTISVANYAANQANYSSRPGPARTPRQLLDPQSGRESLPTETDEDVESDVLPDLTIKVLRKGIGGKNYVV